MSTNRSRSRTIRPPKKYDGEDGGDNPPEKPAQKEVYRLVRSTELNKDLVDQDVYLLWPDNGTWYQATVTKFNAKLLEGDVEYMETDEEEKGIKFAQLVADRQIAFKEARPAGHRLRKDEFDVPEGEPDQDGGVDGDDGEQGEEGDEEEEDDVEDDGARDDDVSVASEELLAEEGARANVGDGGDAGSDDSDDDSFAKPSARVARGATATSSSSGGGARAGPRGNASAQDTAGSAGRAKRGGDPGSLASPGAKRARLEEGTRPSRRPVTPSSKALELLQRARQASAPGGQEDDFSAAERASQSLLATILGKKSAAAAAGQPPGSGQAGGVGARGFYGADAKPRAAPARPLASKGSDLKESEFRERYKGMFTDCLKRAAEELRAGGHEGGDLPDSGQLAERIEAAFHKHYGGLTKEYRARFRSVHFNLADPGNTDFRARVLTGAVQPATLLRMLPQDMASEEKQQWRAQKEEESMKAAVLDSETAARFSTAAALDTRRGPKGIAATIDWRSSSLAAEEGPARAEPDQAAAPDHVPPGGGGASSDADAGASVQRVGSGIASIPRQSSGPKPAAPAPTGAEAGKQEARPPSAEAPAAAPEQDADAKPPTRSPSAIGSGVGGAPPVSTAVGSSFNWASIKAQALQEAHKAEPSSEPMGLDSDFEPMEALPAFPEVPPVMAEGGAARNGAPAREEPPVPDLAPLIASSSGYASDVWTGMLTLPEKGNNIAITADYVGGTADISSLISGRKVLIKGRIPIHKIEAFFEELRSSRSRTCTAALLRCKGDSAALAELAELYAGQERTGVVQLRGSAEAYLLPPGRLARRVLATARGAAPAGAPREGVPFAAGPAQMLLLFIHRRGWQQTEQAEPTDPKASPASPLTSPERPSQATPDEQPSASQASPLAQLAAGAQLPVPQQPAPLAAYPMPGQAGSMDPRQAHADPRQSAAGDPRARPAAQEQGPAPNQASTGPPGPTLPMGLDLSALGALAAALGVGGVALPGGPSGLPGAPRGLPEPQHPQHQHQHMGQHPQPQPLQQVQFQASGPPAQQLQGPYQHPPQMWADPQQQQQQHMQHHPQPLHPQQQGFGGQQPQPPAFLQQPPSPLHQYAPPPHQHQQQQQQQPPAYLQQPPPPQRPQHLPPPPAVLPQPITLQPPGGPPGGPPAPLQQQQQHPPPITLQPPAQHPRAHHQQPQHTHHQQPQQGGQPPPITLRPPGAPAPITLRPPGPAPARGGGGGGRGRGGRDPRDRPRVMGPGASAVAGYRAAGEG